MLNHAIKNLLALSLLIKECSGNEKYMLMTGQILSTNERFKFRSSLDSSDDVEWYTVCT
jgi:hypothetical protein